MIPGIWLIVSLISIILAGLLIGFDAVIITITIASIVAVPLIIWDIRR